MNRLLKKKKEIIFIIEEGGRKKRRQVRQSSSLIGGKSGFRVPIECTKDDRRGGKGGIIYTYYANTSYLCPCETVTTLRMCWRYVHVLAIRACVPRGAPGGC